MHGQVNYMDVENTSEQSGSSESDEQESSVVRYRKVALSLGVLTIGAVFAFAAVGVYPSIVEDAAKSKAQIGTSAIADTQQGLRSQVEQQVVTSGEEPPISIAEFVKSRRLADVAAPALDAKCPMFKPDCDLGEHFKSQIHEEMEALHKHDPTFAQQLYNTTLSTAQKRIIMELLPLAHDKKVIDLGQRVASTVKRWAAQGEKVVHSKVRDALADYSKDHGIAWMPHANTSNPAREGAWEALMNPKILSLIGGDSDEGNQMASRRLFQADPMIVVQSVLGVGFLLRLVLFVFQILHKTGAVLLPLWLKATIMWTNLVAGGITCIATILLWCPILFLQYWFNAWLLFSNQPKQMDDWHVAPFGHWMRTHLPGFDGHKRLLLAADPRLAS